MSEPRRRRCRRRVLLWLSLAGPWVVFACEADPCAPASREGWSAYWLAEGPPGVREIVEVAWREAGTVTEDSRREESLRRILGVDRLRPGARAELLYLLAEMGEWEARLRHRTAAGDKLYFAPEIGPRSPLYPLVTLYRGRGLAWSRIGSSRAPEPARASRRCFRVTLQTFPQNRLARMYLGTPIEAPSTEIDPGAPEWAVLQRESMERLNEIILWWISERQLADGSFGGHFDDDVEMWRWWIPVLLGFDSPAAVESQRRLAAFVWSDPRMRAGYWTSPGKRNEARDVEHSAEPSSDTIVPLLLLGGASDPWAGRARRIADLMATRWMGRNRRGDLQFKSAYFNASWISDRFGTTCDTGYNLRAAQPVLLLWLWDLVPQTSLLVDWSRTWVHATRAAEGGKPAGVIPPSIRWPGGHVAHERWLGRGRLRVPVGSDWRRPDCGTTRAFDWDADYLVSAEPVPKLLALAYAKTERDLYLEPLWSMAEAGHLDRIDEALAKLWVYGGRTDARIRGALEGSTTPYVRYLATGDTTAVLDALRATTAALRINLPGYTQEPRRTDRVLGFPLLFPPGHPSRRTVDPQLLYSMITGDPADPQYFPLAGVRWLAPPGQMAVWVERNDRDALTAQLYHFGAGNQRVGVEFLRLREGTYMVTGNGREVSRFRSDSGGARLELEVPPRRLYRVEVSRSSQSR